MSNVAIFRRTVTVDALQYLGAGECGNLEQVLDFTGKDSSWYEYFDSFAAYEQHVMNDRQAFKIITRHGSLEAFPGDWVVKGYDGEFYPCKPDIFEVSYEPTGITYGGYDR